MKKLILILSLAGMTLCFTGCQKSEEATLPATHATAAEEMNAEMEEEGGEMQDVTAGEESDK